VTDTNSDEPFDAQERPHPTQPSAKAVELFQRALEIQAAKASLEWEPKGRRIEYITTEIALMRELTGSVWGVSVPDVDEHAEGSPAWLRNPWEIASWQDAIHLRRALLDAVRGLSPRLNYPARCVGAA
jgi:hypothetical protein